MRKLSSLYRTFVIAVYVAMAGIAALAVFAAVDKQYLASAIMLLMGLAVVLARIFIDRDLNADERMGMKTWRWKY